MVAGKEKGAAGRNVGPHAAAKDPLRHCPSSYFGKMFGFGKRSSRL